MWYFWKKRKKTWTNKKIAFVSILTSTSVAFVLLFTKIMPIAALPSFKIMFGGLPIKLTGYIFGPLIGAITGIIADLISFTLVPTYIHWWYTLSFSLTGIIPGVVGYIMNKKWIAREEIEKERETKLSNTNFYMTIIILATIFILIFSFIYIQGEQVFAQQKIVKNKWLFLIISTSGLTSMFFSTIFFRFFMKPKTLNTLLPIIVFSALIELINTPIVALGDKNVLDLSGGFITILTGHLLLSPLKIWGNMIIIFFSYKVVSPLIYNKTNNGWDKE